MKCRKLIVLTCCVISSGGWLPAAIGQAGHGTEAAVAKELLQTASVKSGLILHLGCGRAQTPGLTGALAEQSGWLVHGLALDDAACARARRAIEAKGLAGRAMVERIGFKELPYLTDLANLVVVEDLPALTARGVTRDELMRVLAPGGVLCVREGTRWIRTVNPRPKEMDDWTHPQHGADGNMVSEDRLVRFPLGLRWLDGLPLNVNRWAACRGWVVANGRVFTISSTELENVGAKEKPHYLTARDAWNGLPLWKVNCETFDDGAFLRWENVPPLAADDRRVYAPKKDKLIAADAATGQIVRTFPTKFPPTRLLLTDGVLVVGCWEEREPSKAPFDRTSLWATWVAKTTTGSVEAYDAARGDLKWSLPLAALKMVATDGVVYLLTQAGNPPTERHVVAVDLKTGKERWRVSNTAFGPEADLDLTCAGRGYVVVARRKAGAVLVLSPKDGSLLWKVQPTTAHWTPVVDGLLWVGNKKYDPLTGEVKGQLAAGVGGQGCTPSVIVNNIITQSRGCGYTELPTSESDPKAKALRYNAARGACVEGMVPANGMFYTAQNWCRCAPGQVYGFVAIGPSGEPPTVEEFEKPRTVEKGPAFGKLRNTQYAIRNTTDWPFFRHDAERSAATKATVPESLQERWKAQIASPGDGALAGAWRSRLVSCLSAPVVSQGMVFAAKTDAGQVVALDAASGKQAWCGTLGSRIDSPPAIHAGLCFIGCHDGWVYALRASDGQLAWRVRVAPCERRMVAFGAVESVWPTIGAVLVHDGVLYAHAGRTSESDGGIAIVALDPATGAQLWAKNVAPGPLRMNDLLRASDRKIQWHHLQLDPKTGAGDLKVAATKKDGSQGGVMDGSWTLLGDRRAGKAFQVGRAASNLMAWNDTLLVGPSFAITKEKALAPVPEPPPLPDGKKAPPPALKSSDYTWQFAQTKGQQVEAIALTANAVVYAGRDTQAGEDKPTGFIQLVSLADGKKLAELPLDAPPTYDGLAVAGGRVYVSLQNGALVSFAK